VVASADGGNVLEFPRCRKTDRVPRALTVEEVAGAVKCRRTPADAHNMEGWQLLEWTTDSAVGCWLEHIEGGCDVCKPTLGEGFSTCEEGALLRDAALQELDCWPT
jgi:hypothetical protein